MPTLTFRLPHLLNVSAQVGDAVYYVKTNTSAQFTVNDSDIIEIGPITNISSSRLQISCDTMLGSNSYPSGSDYLFFAKDNKINQSNVLGYYAKVQLKNNSLSKSEIYSISADSFESSK